MKPIDSTCEILAFKALNRDIDQKWTEWALKMVMAGFENENLLILAGESEPFNQFQLQSLTTKVLDDLNLDWSDKDKSIRKYACYLVGKSLSSEIDPIKVLEILKDICIELDYEKYLYHFYLLYFAKYDLIDSGNQWYLEEATKENIDHIIFEYFIKWKAACEAE
jgi:hypothetical protein